MERSKNSFLEFDAARECTISRHHGGEASGPPLPRYSGGEGGREPPLARKSEGFCSPFGKYAIAVVALVLAFAHLLPAQVPGPPPPAKFRAVIRYDIQTTRDIHVAQYDAMVKHLQELGFEFNPPLDKLPETNRENRAVNQITGIVPSDNALKMLDNPSVATILLIPEKFKLSPEDVHVRLELQQMATPRSQLELYQQVRVLLPYFGFRETFGYDHHGFSKRPFTRIVGAIPAPLLTILLRDLRTQPANWFEPVIPLDEYPRPLRNFNPVRVVEVLPDPEPLREYLLMPPREPEHLEKIAEELWVEVLRKDQQQAIVRVQLILVGSPPPDDKETVVMLSTAAPSVAIEGWFGSVLSGTVMIEDISRLASLPRVSAIRRPRPVPMGFDVPPAKDNNERALEATGLAGLHQRGSRGKGIRLAIVDTDFRGWDKLVAAKKLPKSTHYVDLSAVTDAQLSAPMPGPPDQIGHGAHCALAATLAAPEAELLLIRMEGADPFEIVDIAEYFKGDYLSMAMSRRQDQLLAERRTLQARREALIKERENVMKNFGDDTELKITFGFLGPVLGWVFSDRELHYQHVAYQNKLEREFLRQSTAFDKQIAKVFRLKAPSPKTLTVVASSFNWQDRYPVGGASALSHWFHRQDRDKILWFQSAGNTRDQAWTGYYRDVDGNGVMEFAPPDAPLKPGRWTREINFMRWQPFSGGPEQLLPPGAHVRLSIQWREPHDKDYFLRTGEEDYYLHPLAGLEIQAIKQRDPDLQTLPADAFELVGRSRKLPVRLAHEKTYSIYEHSTEFVVDRSSRFAARIERQQPRKWVLTEDPVEKRPTFALLQKQTPTGLRPLGVPTLPEVERNWELRIRLFADVLDEKNRPLGRVLFADYPTDEGSMGLPADSLGVYTVGAVDAKGNPDPASALGPPAFQALGGRRPDLLAYDDLQLITDARGSAYGSSIATSFAAGWAASMLSACRSPELLHETIHKQQGKVVRAP